MNRSFELIKFEGEKLPIFLIRLEAISAGAKLRLENAVEGELAKVFQSMSRWKVIRRYEERIN